MTWIDKACETLGVLTQLSVYIIRIVEFSYANVLYAGICGDNISSKHK
jgi:hypothetical protein